MILLSIVIILFFVFFQIFYPYFYTFAAWNYSLFFISMLLLFSNIAIYIGLIVLYLILPDSIKDSFLTFCWNIIKQSQQKLINNVEHNIRETFPIHILHPIPEKSIRIWHPHGSGATTIGIHNVFRITVPELTKTKTVVHYAFTMTPFLLDMVRFMECISSDYQTIIETLKKDSITIGLGGADEMGRIVNKKLEFVIKKRKGIFKIALETGIPIVPVITYGENEIFPETDNEFLIWFNQQFYNVFRLRLWIPSLSSVKNWANLLIKPLDPVHTYTGRPIYVKKIENPTDKHIQSLRKIYISRIIELFDETNSGDFSLKIV